MKKICFLCLCLGLLLVACGGNTRKESSVADAQEEVAVSDGVEVLYFHGKQRCATCIAIEKSTQEVMEKDLADAVRKGEVKFRTIDISREENEAVAEKTQRRGGDRREPDGICFRQCPQVAGSVQGRSGEDRS